MKNCRFLGIAFCLTLLASCNNEELFNEGSGAYTLHATAEQYNPTSRAGFDMDNKGSFFWNNGDKIAVGTGTLTAYTTDCTDGSTTATFTSLSAASGYAIYPYSGAQSISGTTLTYKFASTYNYGSTVDTDFFNGMSVDIPMWAQVVGNSLSFKHLAGVFAFKFPNLKAGQNQTFTMTADKQISGTFTTDLSKSDGDPILETASTETEADKTVSISFSLANDANAVFYVPVPVGIYEIKISLTNGDDTYTQEWKNLEVKRRSIRYTTLSAHSLQGAEAKVVESASEVSAAMANSTNVVVSSVTSSAENATVSIEIPKKDEESANDVHTLAIGSIDDNTETIEITESATGTASIKELIISVPTTDDAKKLSIDMPNTTITIAVNGMGTMTLEEATATTAANTLVVGKNVTIQKLIVKAGNVRIKDGATVSEISRDADNSDSKTYVIYEGTLPSEDNSDASIVYMSAAEWDLRQVLKNGGDYVLTSDIDLALTTGGFLTIESGKSVSIDLNGKTLTTSSASGDNYPDDITVEGTLTVKNGTIKTANTAFYTNGGSLTLTDCRVETSHAGGATAVSVTNNGTLNISGGSYTGVKVDSQHDKYVIGVKGGATASISNATVSGGNGGVTVLGGSTATLTGGSYTGVKACGLYVSENSTVTYSNCTFSGVEGDVVALNGTVNGVSYAEYTKMQQVSTVDELKTAITNGGSVILASDIDLALTTGGFLTLESGKSVSIDLNGKTLTTSSTSGDNYPDDITVKGTLTVKNGTINTANTAFYTNGGNLTLTDCHVKTSHAGGATAVSVTNNGTLNISGGSYTGVKVDSEHDKYVIGVKGGSTANINTTVSGGNGGVTVLGGSTATLTGGSYSGVKACGLFVNQSSTVTYSNCTFSGVEGAVIVGSEGGTVNSTSYSGYTKVQ